MPLTKSDALNTLSQRPLTPRTQQIADYWLSLWDQDMLPARTAIRPAAIKPLLPGIIFFMVVSNRSVHVGLAGTGFRANLGRELKGMDWMDLTPPQSRLLRLSIFSWAAKGAIAFNHWRFTGLHGNILDCEKLLLPLRPEQGEAIPVLGFVDWNDAQSHHLDPFDLSDIPPPTLFDSVPFLDGGGTLLNKNDKPDQRKPLHDESPAQGHHRR